MIPAPHRLPFDDPSNTAYLRDKTPEHIACIIYHRDSNTGRLEPHSVFTAQEVPPEKRRRHAGGNRRPFYFGEWDFCRSRTTGETFHHNSGNGAPYVHPLSTAPRYRREPWYRQQPHNSAAIWWNPKICTIQKGWGLSRSKREVPARSLRALGYTILKHPARLWGRHVDPFTPAGRYEPRYGCAEWCQICADWISDEEPCTHFWECEGDSPQPTGPGLEDAFCECQTREECRAKCGGREP